MSRTFAERGFGLGMAAVGTGLLLSVWDNREKWAAGKALSSLFDLGLDTVKEGKTAGNADAELAPEGPKREAQVDRDRQRLIDRGWTLQPDGTLRQPATGPDSPSGK